MSQEHFWIQASAPQSTGVFNADDCSLEEAIETAFPLATERAVMAWHYSPVLLSYKYDVSCIMLDILEMLHALSAHKGDYEVYWPSNTFSAHWVVSWTHDDLHVSAQWNEVVGADIRRLRDTPDLVIRKQLFVCEWKELLLRALRNCGYDENLAGFRDLEQVCAMLPETGQLYRTTAY